MTIFYLQVAILVLTVLAVIGVWRHPRYFLPVLIFALPLDISQTWFPHLSWLDKLGSFIGVITFARIFSLALVAYYLFSRLRPWLWAKKGPGFWADSSFYPEGTLQGGKPAWQTALFLALIGMILYGLLSAVWSVNPLQSIVQSVRLGVLLFLGLASYQLIQQERSPWLVPLAFSLASTLLGLIGIFEMVTQRFLWNGEVYQAAGRINATFVDANIYARFLVIGVIATLLWMIARENRWVSLGGALALVVQLTALVGTGSRTGWMCAFVALVGLLVLVPRRQLLWVLAGGCIAGLLALAVHPEFLLRLADLRKGLAVASLERQYLIKAGWDMFIHHPWLGVGLGGFQTMMFTHYPDLIHNQISLSHTALLTTAAELGIIGVSGVFAVMIFTYRELLRRWSQRNVTFQFTGFAQTWVLTVFAVLSITVIFLSAQGEGRFFEDPALWLLAGFLMALRNVEEV